MKLIDVNLLKGGKAYLTDEKKYIKNKDRILYTGEYISQDSLENIKIDASKHLMENFTIPIVYNNYDKNYGNIIEISKDCYDNLYHAISEEKIKNNAHNYLTVDINSSIKNINYFLCNNLYDNFILLFNKDNKQKIYHLVKEFYNQIEDILVEDISKSIEQYKEDNNINNFFDKKKTNIKNPIIQESLDNVIASINTFVSQLDNNTRTTLLSHPHRKGRNTIIKKSEKYLMERYHNDELHYLSYKENFEMLTTSVDQIYYSFGKEIPKIKDGEELTKEGFYIEKLRENITDYLDNITSLPSEEEIDDILEEIDDTIFDPFIRGYHELDEDEDTGSQSRELAEDFSNIKNYIEKLLHLIEYKNHQKTKSNNGLEENIDILSARDLFNKICTYNKSGDSKNLINAINKLEECENKEISNMLSQNELQILVNILAKEEIYKFAIRIRDELK